MSDGELEPDLGFELDGELAKAFDFVDFTIGGRWAHDSARAFAAGVRGECMSVRLPGVPFSDHIAEAADWWAGLFVDTFGEPAGAVRNLHECVTSSIQDFIGVDVEHVCPDGTKPRKAASTGPLNDGFMVEVPGWEDIFIVNNEAVFDERDRKQRALDHAEALRRSPTPPSLQEVGEILTTLDDLQDEAATLAVALMIAEKLAGRTIPGVGWVATAADALNLITALATPASGSGMPGRRGKRMTKEKARHTTNGYRGRLERTRRVDEFERIAQDEWLQKKPQIEKPAAGFKFGLSDVLQGLQATESVFGYGIQLGPVFGFLQDAFWLGVRGGDLRVGRLPDPFGFREAEAEGACFRSPALKDVHPDLYYVLANEALSLWSKAGRIMPWVDVLGEQAFASTLTGLRLSEQVLGPWLRSGRWIEPLGRAISRVEVVRGGQQEFETRGLRPDEWMARTAPAATAAMRRAIGNVPDPDRQSLYESMASSVAWGLVSDLEPEGRVLDHGLTGPIRDAFILLDVNRIPRFDLED